MAQGINWRYDRKCWNLNEEEKEKLKKRRKKAGFTLLYSTGGDYFRGHVARRSPVPE